MILVGVEAGKNIKNAIILINMGHKVIIIPGLGDQTNLLERFSKRWYKSALSPVVHSFGWNDKNTDFTTKLNIMLRLIDDLKNDGHTVSLVGTSAGGSAVINAYVSRKDMIHRVVTVCSRLRTGKSKGFRSFKNRTSSCDSFAESVRSSEENISKLRKIDLHKIMTVSALFGDELVPRDTSSIDGARNIYVPTAEHMLSIGASLSIFSGPLVSFINSNEDYSGD